jgi:hypothetical protein
LTPVTLFLKTLKLICVDKKIIFPYFTIRLLKQRANDYERLIDKNNLTSDIKLPKVMITNQEENNEF